MSKERSPHIRVDTHPTRKFAHHLNPHGMMKEVNAKNPMLHLNKEHKKGDHLYGHEMHTIVFGQVWFDKNAHLLFVDAQKDGKHMRCSITEDALHECYQVELDAAAMERCFRVHEGDISKALEKKWMTVNDKTMCLEENDLREFIKK